MYIILLFLIHLVDVKKIQYYEVDGELYDEIGQRLIQNPDGTFTEDYNTFLKFKFNNTTIHYVNHTVNKLWENGSESSVEVQLLQDGTPYGAPVVLNDANAWTYTWQQLDDSYTWSVVEVNIPEGYQATTVVSPDGLTTTITNTKVVTPAQEDPTNPTDTTVTQNKPRESVKTNDSFNILAWSLILGTSFVSILFTMYIRRKTQNEHS